MINKPFSPLQQAQIQQTQKGSQEPEREPRVQKLLKRTANLRTRVFDLEDILHNLRDVLFGAGESVSAKETRTESEGGVVNILLEDLEDTHSAVDRAESTLEEIVNEIGEGAL